MMRKKFKIQLVLLLSLLILIGCEKLGCQIIIKPLLPDKTFAMGKLDVEYFDKLTASIKHSNREQDYNFYFDISGELPSGIEILADNFRTLYFQGTPVEKGTFTFYVLVEIEQGYYDDDDWGDDDDAVLLNPTLEVCNDTTRREYTIIIQ